MLRSRSLTQRKRSLGDSSGGWRGFGQLATALGIWAIVAAPLAAQAPPVAEAPPESAATQIQNAEGVHVLGRGPIHEAFASPVERSDQASMVSPETPPVSIDEAPPNVRPAEAVWIPGYWFWDELSDDFVWVSGTWRVPPPGQQWVPGYWQRLDNGARWISGFWAPVSASAVSYVEPPPENRDRGPTYNSPGDDYFWVPGVWMLHETGYRWREGYWARHQPGWMWIPQHYTYTPRGAVLTGGYWDYPIEQRGMAFSPIYFATNAFRQGGFQYTPTATIVNRYMLLHMFAGPQWHHYFFGDYYGRAAAEAGVIPWFKHKAVASDPLLSYYRWYFAKQDVNYLDRMNNWFAYYNANQSVRPPVLYADQQALTADVANDPRVAYSIVTQPITAMPRAALLPVTPDQQSALAQLGQELKSLSIQRYNIEVENLSTAAADARPVLPLPAVARQFFPAIASGPAVRREVMRPAFDEAGVGPAEAARAAAARADAARVEAERAAAAATAAANNADLPAPALGADVNVRTPTGSPEYRIRQGRPPEYRQEVAPVAPVVEPPVAPADPVVPRSVGRGVFTPGGDPGRNTPDLQRTDVNIPGQGQTPEGPRPGVGVPGRTEAIIRPRGSGAFPGETPSLPPPARYPGRIYPGRGVPESPWFYRVPPDRGSLQGTAPAQADIGLRGIDADVPAVETPTTVIPGRNDLNAGERPEVNVAGVSEPPRGYVPGRVAPGIRRPSIYQPGINVPPGRDDAAQVQTQDQTQAQMPRVQQPEGTDIPQVDPSTGQRMPRLAPSQQNPADRRSMFRGVNPDTNPPRTSPSGNAPRVSPPAENARQDPAALPSQAPQTGGPRTNTPQAFGGATELPGSLSPPGSISPNFGGATPNIGGMSRPGGTSPTGGQPHAGNNPGPVGTRGTGGTPGTSGTTGSAGGGGGGTTGGNR